MNRDNLIMARLAIILAIFLTATVGNAQATTQQSSDIPFDKVKIEELTIEQIDNRTDELLRKITLQLDTLKRYANQMKNASEEDRLVLDLQLISVQRESFKDLLQLTDVLLKLEQKKPQPKLRNQVEKLIEFILPRFQFNINLLRGEIDGIRALRPKSKAEQHFTIELKVAKYTERLDIVFGENLRVLKIMKQMGMNTEQAQSELVKSLYERADELSGRIALALIRIEGLKVQRKKFPDDADTAKLLTASIKNLETNTNSLEKILKLMDKLDLDTDSFRGDLVIATRDFSSGLTDTGVAVKLVNRTFNNITGWLAENGFNYLFKLLVFLGIIFIFRLASRLVRSGLDKALDKSKLNLSQLGRQMIVSTASNLVMFFGLLIALSQLDIKLGPLLAGLGVAGFIVGFALQDTLGNFASGMMILLYRPYDVSNLIEVGGVLGKVDKMNLVSTSLRTLDNQLIVIPNNKIWGDVIKNVTAQKRRRVDMVFGISYTDDIPKAERILEDILKSNDRVLDEPKALVRLHTLGASSVDFIVRPWVKADDYWDVYWDVTRTVKLRFDEEGISIPFPQQDVHIHTNLKEKVSANNTDKPNESLSIKEPDSS
jgi:small conductance mechanosensitive channel